MTDFEHEAEVPVSAYGAQRRAAWLAHHQANSDMAEAASMQAHGQSEDRRVVQAGQAGLFGHATPQEMGAAVAARQAVVGSDYGGRPLERLGGTFDHGDVGCSPAPSRVDLRFVNEPGGQHPTGESAWETWKREQR